MNKYNPEQSEEELLDAIKSETDACAGNTALPLQPFATLLVKLSRASDAQAKANLMLQKTLIIFTVLIIGMTLALLYLGFEQLQVSKSQLKLSNPDTKNHG